MVDPPDREPEDTADSMIGDWSADQQSRLMAHFERIAQESRSAPSRDMQSVVAQFDLGGAVPRHEPNRGTFQSKDIYIRLENTIYGPITQVELAEMLASGELTGFESASADLQHWTPLIYHPRMTLTGEIDPDATHDMLHNRSTLPTASRAVQKIDLAKLGEQDDDAPLPGAPLAAILIKPMRVSRKTGLPLPVHADLKRESIEQVIERTPISAQQRMSGSQALAELAKRAQFPTQAPDNGGSSELVDSPKPVAAHRTSDAVEPGLADTGESPRQPPAGIDSGTETSGAFGHSTPPVADVDDDLDALLDRAIESASRPVVDAPRDSSDLHIVIDEELSFQGVPYDTPAMGRPDFMPSGGSGTAPDDAALGDASSGDEPRVQDTSPLDELANSGAGAAASGEQPVHSVPSDESDGEEPDSRSETSDAIRADGDDTAVAERPATTGIALRAGIALVLLAAAVALALFLLRGSTPSTGGGAPVNPAVEPGGD